MTTPSGIKLKPGTILLSTIDGRTGAFVRFAQWFMGASWADAKWSHVALVGDSGYVYEAMPAGMQRNKLQGYLDDLASGDEVMFINVPLSIEQRYEVVRVGERLVADRVGYSFATYLYQFLKRIGFRTHWIRNKIADSRRLLCSQAVDHMLTTVGWTVFDDGRSYLDVVPSDFVKLVREDVRYSVIDLTVVE